MSLDEVFLGIRHADIGKHVAAADCVGSPAHGLLSFVIRSACRSRLSIGSLSAFGVSRPDFDLSWKV